MARRCVYTCLIGDYERLNEQPIAAKSSLEFVCFTDDPGLTSASWRIVPLVPTFPLDHVRSQRVLKILPEEILAEHDASLYIDNTVILKETPEILFEEFLADGDFALPWHSFRDSVTDEFLEALRLGLDDGPRLVEQLNHYSMTTPEVLRQRPYWNGILFRRHGVAELQRAMRLWLRHVLRYSRRDQLSLNYALSVSGVSPRTIKVDIYSSAFHEWPRIVGRDRNARLRNTAESMLPPGVLAQRLLDEAAAATRDMQAAQQRCAEMEAEIVSMRQRVESASRAHAAHVARLERELDVARAGAEAWQAALEATRQSTSWRLTGLLRRLRFLKPH